MKKSELIERVAEKAQTSKAAAARVVDAIFDTGSGAIAEAVRAGKQVSIPGFGKFRPKERAARKGRNPRTGREIQIPKSTVVSFTAGKGLKDAVGKKGIGRNESALRNEVEGLPVRAADAVASPARAGRNRDVRHAVLQNVVGAQRAVQVELGIHLRA